MTRKGKPHPGRGDMPKGPQAPPAGGGAPPAKVRRAIVALADGRRISLADLPPADTQRWVASRKELVAIAVRHGLISADEACARYDLSPEELEGWIAAWMRHGRAGLKVSAARRPAATRRRARKPAGSDPPPDRASGRSSSDRG